MSCSQTARVVSMIFAISTFVDKTQGYRGLPKISYKQLRDLNIGFLIPVHTTVSVTELCKKLEPHKVAITEAIVYSIDKVNRNSSILPGIQLGFVFLDTCEWPSVTMAQTTAFVSSYDHKSDAAYDVMGVYSYLSSSYTIMTSYLLGAAELPYMSSGATSDRLSDKSYHPYFLRIVPPDKFQARAILKVLQHFNWSRISILYNNDDYGRNLYELMVQAAHETNICISEACSLSTWMPASSFDTMVKRLLSHNKSKVVVLITDKWFIRKIFNAVEKAKAVNQFVWIGTDTLAGFLKRAFHPGLIGAISVNFMPGRTQDFLEHFASITPPSTTNPWFTEFWEIVFNCSMSEKTCPEKADAAKYTFLRQLSYCMDAVSVFARAADRVMSEHCPHAKGDTIKDCVTTERLFPSLMKTSFRGRIGEVKFQETGDLLGRYVISQAEIDKEGHGTGDKFVQREFATYDSLTDSLEVHSKISFSHVAHIPTLFSGTPMSLCWSKCKRFQYIRGLRCIPCPTGQWPDKNTTFTSCRPITPEPFSFDSWQVGMLSFMCAFGLSYLTVTALFYGKLWNEPIIRASSRELCVVTLIGVFLGFVDIIILSVVPATKVSCVIVYVLSSQTFTWIYGPLVLRTWRIRRIFQESLKGIRRVSLVDVKTQMFLFLAILMPETLIIIGIVYMFDLGQKQSVPSKWVERVVIACEMPPQLLVAMAYNIVLLFICTILAFKTRHLPDNYRETWYITLCVYTTLILYAPFVPSYVSTKTVDMKIFLWSLVIFLNHNTVLSCMFLPKFYAVLYVDQKKHHLLRIGQSHWSAPMVLNLATMVSDDNLTQGASAMDFYPSASSRQTGAEETVGSFPVSGLRSARDVHQSTTVSSAVEFYPSASSRQTGAEETLDFIPVSGLSSARNVHQSTVSSPISVYSNVTTPPEGISSTDEGVVPST